jgi:KaiC/GvpD/RAD55 family RecA-like ATPase
MLDAKVVESCLQSREAYEKVRDFVDEKELSLQGQTWFPLIRSWYEADRGAKAVDREILIAKGTRELPEAHLDTLIGWIQNLPSVDSPVNVVNDLLELKRYVKGNELSQAIQARQNEKVTDLLGEYSELLQATELGGSEVIWTMDDTEMDGLLDRANLIKVGPSRLNDKLLGGVIPGTSILIFGRPEAGKTLFTVNMVAGFLKFGHRVLYVGNEEGTYRTRKRIINNLSNRDNDAYQADPDGTIEIAKSNGLEELHILTMHPGTVPEIESLVKDVQPSIVVVDQIRNLDFAGKGGDNITTKLGELGTQMRNMANRHDFVSVSVTQAGDKTERHGQEPPPWLTMSDVADNRTSLAGQFDVILGIGCTEELRRNNTRAISICKNKMSDAEDAHEGFMVNVDVRRSKVR